MVFNIEINIILNYDKFKFKEFKFKILRCSAMILTLYIHSY